ncbi:MAG: hypothetical protein AB1716_02800 [Planctomycetota bacterium]
MSTTTRWSVLAFTTLALISTAPAETIVNTFGPGHDGWDWKYDFGWTVAGPNAGSQFGVQQAFLVTATADGPVTDVWVGFFRNPSSVNNQVIIRLARNPSNLPPTPGDVLEEWTITGFETWSAWSPPKHMQGTGVAVLEAGRTYWLWAEGLDSTNTGWGMNGGATYNPALTAPHTLRRHQSGTWQPWMGIFNETVSAMRIDMAVRGDLNCDGVVNFDDINPFVLALSDPAGYQAAYPTCNILTGDCNGDGLVNFDDINPFVALLTTE